MEKLLEGKSKKKTALAEAMAVNGKSTMLDGGLGGAGEFLAVRLEE